MNELITLFIRVLPKAGLITHFRCGIQFTKAWQKIEDVDHATAARLKADQMLDVTDTRPTDFPADAEAETQNEAPTNGAPQDPAERLEIIRTAIAGMDKENAKLWTTGGKPKTEAIEDITGWAVSAAERDAALVEGQ